MTGRRVSHPHGEEDKVSNPIALATFVAVLIAAGAAAAQGMLLDYAADRVIQKYQTSTCEQLKARRDEPKSEKDKLAIDFLRNDTQARIAFIDKIAAPVANKMFECGMFP
jgi:hypothetical protein